MGDHFCPVLEQCVHDLADKLANIPGAEIEDNRLTVSMHYRHVSCCCHHDTLMGRKGTEINDTVCDQQVAPTLQSVVEGIIDDYTTHQPSLVKKHGKKVFELRSQVDWNKGRAVLYYRSSDSTPTTSCRSTWATT